MTLMFVYSGSASHAGRNVIFSNMREDNDHSGPAKDHPPFLLSCSGFNNDVVSGIFSVSVVSGGSVRVKGPSLDDSCTVIAGSSESLLLGMTNENAHSLSRLVILQSITSICY